MAAMETLELVHSGETDTCIALCEELMEDAKCVFGACKERPALAKTEEGK